ncbi:cell adhesion molecule Dscam1-like [Tachypleus tridentatus]|uniref:cell adhesion molecule Dscam1-like n=1 Tax=Tachypleus tridentatus TaxID=6853 RepID=UPI003FD2CBDF
MFVVKLLKRRHVSKNRIGLFSEKTNIILFISTITELCVASSLDRFGPRFVHEPPSLVEFDNNTDTMVHCSARGSPIPRITWTHKDGSDIGDVPGLRHVRSDGSLFFPSFRSDNYRPDIHDATYICVASNVVGTLGSRDVRIKGVVQRHFKVQVHDEFVMKGNVAVLQCHVPSFVREYVSVAYWKREDGVVIRSTVSKGGRYSVLPNGELHIRDVTSKDGLAGYRCHVRHRLTSDITFSTDVGRLVVKDPHIVSPPRVRTQQQRIQAVRGKDVELTCVSQAFPAPTYRWYRDHYLISSSSRLTIVDSSLLIEQVEITDSGKYVCIANNSLGEKSVQITLMVTAPILAEIQPETQEVRIGKPAILNCTVSGHPVHSVHWKKNNQPLVEDGRIRLLSREVLYISKVKREDQGMYQCFVYNSQESTQGSAELKLREVAPSMMVTFPERKLKPGMSLSLRCSASGNPLPVITWKLDGFPIPETSRLRIGDFVTSHGHVVSYVNISDVRVEDGGEYTCKATNAVKSVTHAGKINVYGPPIIRQMENVTVLSGETVTLRCAVSGYPIKSITWERDGSPLPLTHRQKVESHGTLIVRKMERPADDGEYICIAKSPEGLTARGRIYVIIKVAPLIDEEFFPETKIVSQGMRVKLVCAIIKGDTPIRIRWMKDGGAVVRENKRRVQTLDDSSLLVLINVSYSDSGNYTCLASNNAATVNRTTTLVVNVPPQWTMEPSNSNVVHGSRISVDCMAEGFPKPRIFWKKSSVPGGPPLNVHVEVTGSQSLKVTWTPPKPELQHGIIQGYYLGYKQTDSDHPFQYKRIEKSTGPHHITYLTNLKRNTNYTVLVQAFNNVGAGPRSDETYAVTLKAAPPTSPVISVMSTSSSTITIQWKPDRNADTMKEYTLHYKHDGSDWKKESINVKSNRYTIKDLKCGTWYRLFMTSSNSLGSGEPRDPITIRTIGGAPVSPRKEDFIQPNTTFLTLNLEAWYNGGCPIQNFNVQYRTTFQRRWNTASLPLIVPQNQSIIRHLAPGREYNLLVNARNEAGTTEAEYTVKTLNLSLTSPAITALPPVLEDSYLPFYRNLTVLLPVAVSIVVLLVVIVTVIVCLRRQSDISSRASSGDSQSRKGRQADAVGMVDFYQKGVKEGDISLKSSTYFSPASGKSIGITFHNRHRHHDDNHEYAEPYAAVPPPKCVTRDGCPTMLSVATRTEGPYTTMKRSPPRPLTYLPSINEGVKVRNSRQMAQLERPITCNNSGTSSSGSSGDRPSSM